MTGHLCVTIPDHNNFYSIYADGKYSWKTYDRIIKSTLLYYPPGSAVFLYYTYPTHREACVIRYNAIAGGIMLPGLSKHVSVLLQVHASRVDKLKRACGFLSDHTQGAFVHDDGFYIRLSYLLQQRGKLNYSLLRKLSENSPVKQRSLYVNTY